VSTESGLPLSTAPPASVADPGVARAFRVAMSRLAAPVVMVTTWLDRKPWGLTISACCSVSVDPPLFLISLASGTVSTRTIREHESFGVSLLGERLLPAAHHGSRKGAPKFVEGFCEPAGGGDTSRPPVVAGALAHLDCRLADSVEVADHTLLIGSVESVEVRTDDQPLVYYDRLYRVLAPTWPHDPVGDW
jgi:flavin reductase ActVB